MKSLRIYGSRAALFLALAFEAAIHAQVVNAPSISSARQVLAEKHFGRAKTMFAELTREHPDSVEARLGLADAELALHQYETAEVDYRRVVAVQPELWLAHKNLVIVEAALGRWEEFDREQALLRDARNRGAPGIGSDDTDVIDSFTVHGRRWIVREYFELSGRSLTRYNFENFAPDGRVKEYISLESAEDAQNAVPGGEVRIGPRQSPSAIREFALNWYTGKAHGQIALYPHAEPTYEKVRADVFRFLLRQR